MLKNLKKNLIGTLKVAETATRSGIQKKNIVLPADSRKDILSKMNIKPTYYLYCVVRNKKMLLPSHKHVVCLLQLRIAEVVRVKAPGILVKR